jgi:signal transduction histidine kinase
LSGLPGEMDTRFQDATGGTPDDPELQRREAYAGAMSELMSHIAHEVNQPLAAIAANGNACMRWLAADPPNLGEASAAAERIVRDARRASDVIGEMRAYLSRSPRSLEPVAIGALVQQCVTRAASLAIRHHVALSVQAGEAAPPVVAHGAALRQALEQLITNAIEACAEGAPPREVRVLVRGPERGEMTITVEDTGPGFIVDKPQRLFEPLYSTKPGRLGLGLAVARSAFEEHGGRLVPQRGADGVTRFVATLPLEATVP